MVADHLSECITKSLAELGFEHGFFDITLEVKDPAPNGMDTIEFDLLPMRGRDAPVATIASSGEISRDASSEGRFS